MKWGGTLRPSYNGTSADAGIYFRAAVYGKAAIISVGKTVSGDFYSIM